MRRALLQADLAAALGISASMVSRLKRRGMPTHSIAAAVEWRRQHLDVAQLAEQAARRRRAIPAGDATPRTDLAGDGRQALEQIALLAELAAADFDRWGERLRSAMAVLPRVQWDDVALPVALWEQLLGPHLAALDAECLAPEEPTEPVGGDRGIVDDVVYGLAAGLYRIEPVDMSARP